MAYSDKELLLDKKKRPIPQLWDESKQEFVPYTADSMKVSISEMVAKEPFSGLANTTKTFTEDMSGFVISNDGASDLTFTIGTDIYTVKAGEVFEETFEPFTSVTITTTVAFRAYGKKATASQVVTQPPADTTDPIVTASHTTGTFNSTQSFTLTANEAATIYYTLDGSTPTESSAVYSSAISVASTKTIKYFAKDTAGNTSEAQSVTLTIDTTVPDTTAPTVTISPNGGTFTSAQTVTLTASETATIYYTTDGSTPTEASTVYSAPITVSANATVKAIAKDAAGNVTATPASATFVIDTVAPTVTVSPEPGTFTSSQSVTLSSEVGATIYYTIDGSTPTTSSSVYSSPIAVSSTTTIKYIAKDTAGNSSAVQTATYTISAADTTAPTVTASPTAGTYSSTQSVTLDGSDNSGAEPTIYYTTDGSTPTESSTVYSAPISVSETTTIKWLAKDTAGNTSTGSAAYTINASAGSYRMYLNGIGDSIKLPWGVDMTAIEIECAIKSQKENGTTNTGYIVDERPDSSLHTYGLSNFYVGDAGVGLNVSGYYIDDVAGTDKTSHWGSIPRDTKVKLKYTPASAFKSAGNIGKRADAYNTNFLRMDVYTIKIYNGATLMASYDFTNQFEGTTVPDSSGNGRTATLTGGTWVSS